jgi:hypothetical protein
MLTRGDHQRLHFREDDSNPRKGRLQRSCKRGHLFLPENTYIDPKGVRICIACRTTRKREWRKRQRFVASIKGRGG